jgi:hypothetical protein
MHAGGGGGRTNDAISVVAERFALPAEKMIPWWTDD